MTHLRFVLNTLLLVVALLSAQVASGVSVNKTYSIVSLSSIKLDYGQFIDKAHSVSLSALTTAPVKYDKHIDEQPKQSDFESVQFRLALSNSSLFLHQVQVEPNYTPIFEFFTPSLARELYLKPLAPPITRPWYTAYEGKKNRLSGWKDANLLYRAVTTYHS